MKIIDKINDSMKSGKPFYSFEFFPPKTEAGLHNLYARLDRMAQLEPLFVDVTWGAGGNSETNKLSLEMSKIAQQYFGLDVMMHLTCTQMPVSEIDKTLAIAKDVGIQNIMALRGDPPEGSTSWEKCDTGFSYASELTEHIRNKYGDFFGIGAGAYPEGHIECSNKDQDIINLKKKVDAGVEFIVTQLFYDMDEFYQFVERCRAADINVPIIPGMLPIQTYDRFIKFTSFCQTKVPQHILDALEPIKGDDAAVKAYGVQLTVDMCKDMMKRGIPGFHFYTLNLESSVSQILTELGFVGDDHSKRSLPWRPSKLEERSGEDVRPIYWSNRPKSYLSRTANWDDFPNGRWGDSRSPTFGNLSGYYRLKQGIGLLKPSNKRIEMWGEPESQAEINEVFAKFCQGEINMLPWCEMPVQNETCLISKNLSALNRAGLLTINSQPQVNGALSDDPQVGWGREGGRVYQKAYVEFFVNPKTLMTLMEELGKYPSMTFQAINKNGVVKSNLEGRHVNAVTWGVFPGKEVVQPTVVDSDSFKIWKDEAFGLWMSDWGNLYNSASPARNIMQKITNEWWLVNVVENDFVDGDIWKLFSNKELGSIQL